MRNSGYSYENLPSQHAEESTVSDSRALGSSGSGLVMARQPDFLVLGAQYSEIL